MEVGTAATLELRPAGVRDLEALVSLSLACSRAAREWAGPEWLPSHSVVERGLWWERLREGGAWVGVAVAGVTRVGCVATWPGGERPLAYLAGPLVDPEWRREGIGRRLHEEALTTLQSLGYRRAELLVEAGNGPARSFLQGTGWQREDSERTRSPMHLIRYTRALDPPRGRRFVRASA